MEQNSAAGRKHGWGAGLLLVDLVRGGSLFGEVGIPGIIFRPYRDARRARNLEFLGPSIAQVLRVAGREKQVMDVWPARGKGAATLDMLPIVLAGAGVHGSLVGVVLHRACRLVWCAAV